MSKDVQTVEKTSKKFKLQILLSVLLFIIGICVVANDPASNGGIAMTGIGILWYIVTKIRIWWNHG